MSINFLKSHSTDHGSAPAKAINILKFNTIINYCLMALVLILPLFFLPFTSETREFNKQMLLFWSIVIALGVWIIKILTVRSVSWVKTSLDFVLLGYLAIYFFSSLFSLDQVSSFLGYYGRFTGSFISVVSFVALYYLIVNTVRTEKLLNKIHNALLISGGIVMVYSLLQLLGVYTIPLELTKLRSFNPIGSMVALSIFTSLILVFIQWTLLARPLVPWKKVALIALTLIGLSIMFLINAFIGWLMLCLGSIIFMALSMVLSSDRELLPTWFWKPMLVLVVSIIFVGFHFLPSSINPRQMVELDLPVEVQLSNSTTLNLVKNSLASGPKQAVLGSGPGTTGIAFGDIKPESLNKTVVWSLTFDRASTEVANITIETGILGLLAFEATAILFLIYGLFFLLKKAEHSARMQAYGLFAVWLTLYISHFFYFYNTTFYFLYWLTIASFMAVAHWHTHATEEKELSFASSPRSTLSWMFASMLILVLLLIGGFFQTAVYIAEAAYTSGLKTLNKPDPDFKKVEKQFARAVRLNNYRDVYYLAYGQNLIFMASKEAAVKNPNIANIQAWMANAVNAGAAATRVSPAKAGNWSALAQFYNNIRPLGVAGTDQAIISSWTNAVERDPKNPALLVRLANAYTLASETIDPGIVGSGADTDADGLSDIKEQELKSDANNPDSNQNGTSDGDEVKSGFNPAGAGRLTQTQLSRFIKLDKEMLRSAEDALRKSIELKGDLVEARLLLSRVLEKGGNLTEARSVLDQAVRSFPNNIEIKFEQGKIAYNQRKYEDAEKIFNEVVKMEPNHANALFSLALIYQQKGDSTLALAQFKKVREMVGPNLDLERIINELEERTQSQP